MSWFSFSGIAKEIKKIRWPQKGDLATNSVQVIIFTLFFGIFFVCCEFIISMILNLLGVIG